MKVTKQYKVKTAPDPWVIVSFSDVLTTVKFLNEVGPDNLTSDAIVDEGEVVHGTGRSGRAGAAVRQVPGRAGGLQRPHAVLHLPREERLQEGRLVAAVAAVRRAANRM